MPQDLTAFRHEQIRQGYLVIGADGSEARVRDRAGVCTLTVKSKGDLSRGEYETEISEDQFATLWPATDGKRVEKTRYTIPTETPTGDLAIELDIYSGKLEGLVVAEVEFDSEFAAGLFETPDWFGQEVTTDKAYKNQSLAS